MPVKTSFAQNRKQAEDAGMLGKGGFYKYQEGDNRIRLLSECLPHVSVFSGQRNFKWLCYILDRRDGKVKAHFMPHKVYKAIEALQLNPDYSFDEVPMPFDLTIHAKGAGTKEVEYTVLPARKEVPLTKEEELEFYKQTPLDEVKAKLDEKQQQKGGSAPSAAEPPSRIDEELTDDNIPF